MTREELVARVEAAVRERGGDPSRRESNFTCPEPAHHENADAHPSARWNSQKKAWHCPVGNIGGGYVDLGRCLGIVSASARREKRKAESRRVLCAYDYRDETGTLLFQVVRYEPKGFAQRRPHEKGYIYDLNGVRRVLYRLRELLAADPALPVYTTEGEKDADALAALGLVATTNPGGVRKWRAEYNEAFRGRRVVILPDNDKHGRDHAGQVAAALHGIAQTVRIVTLPGLPDKGDVSDWLAAGHTAEELEALVASTPEWKPAPRDADKRALPVVVVSNRPLRDITADAFGALVAANDPPELFVRLGSLARIRRDQDGRPIIDVATESVVRHRLARVAEFVRVTQKGAVPVPPPIDVVRDLIALGTWRGLPALEAVTEVPVLRPDGSVFDVPGYDGTTRLVYAPAPGLVIPRVPVAPTRAVLEAACATAWDIMAEFLFADTASAANALGLLLTPIMRPAISGPAPLALLDKPKRGTGATLLVQVIEAVAIGNTTDLMTAPRDDEEWRKKITAALLSGNTFMFFDNVEHTLSSPSLAAALTTSEWSDRILGRSEMARSVPQRATWMATGNNLKVGGDLARRCYSIRLDARVARPWTRTGFRHERLVSYVLQHRGHILHALLTMVRAWYAAGCPKPSVPALGNFDEWAVTIGGVLAHAGFKGFLGNLERLYEQVDEEEVAWEAFVACWYETYNDRAVTVSELTTDLRSEGSRLREALPPDLAEALVLDGKGKGSFAKRLGKALSKRVDAVFGTLRIERPGDDEHMNTARWRVQPAPAGGFGGFAGFPWSVSQPDEGAV